MVEIMSTSSSRTAPTDGQKNNHRLSYKTFDGYDQETGNGELDEMTFSPSHFSKVTFSSVLGIVSIAMIVAMMTVLFSTSTNVATKPAVASSAPAVIHELKAEPTTTTPKTTEGKIATSSNRPNFVFILADDLGFSNVGYRNSDYAPLTPTLDSMSSNGILMEHYYAQEMCTPGRSALMTGRYPSTVGVQYGEIGSDDTVFSLPKQEILFPQVMQDAGYKTYMLGKWNLGHYSPDLIPTARGFDEYLGYLGSQQNYWSHKQDGVYDLTVANSECYDRYDANGTYSTFLFTQKAVDIVHTHDFNANPMLLYIAHQATHDPFGDEYYPQYVDGIPNDYVPNDVYGHVFAGFEGEKHQQLALSLYLMDRSISEVINAIDEVGQKENTYFVFTSDNGGCDAQGGYNGPLRGNKGSLFEGGTRVDAVIYSDLLPATSRGSTYNGLMHVTDWFPTIMEWAGISYRPGVGHALDGISQASSLSLSGTDSEVTSPENGVRKDVLYNIMVNVEEAGFVLGSNTNAAIRDGRYKLIYAYTNNSNACWQNFNVVDVDDDTALTSTATTCDQTVALTGQYELMLFDLHEDPFEKNNLYNNTAYSTQQASLEAKLYHYGAIAAVEGSGYGDIDDGMFAYVESHRNFLQPWLFDGVDDSSPKACSSSFAFA